MTVDELVGNEYVALVHPSERDDSRGKMLALLASRVPSVDLDRLYRRADQTEFWGRLTGRQLLDANGTKRGLVGVIADIDVNEAFTPITGYEREEVLGQKPRMLKSRHHDAGFYADLWRELTATGHWYGEIWNRRKNGEVYAEMKTISAVRDTQGNVLQYVALFSDITPIKEHEKQLEQIAHYDVLTTLPNRVLLADRLHQAMVHASRYRQILDAAYLDLDGFKAINDTFGHETGDQLLIALSARMKATLRESDTLARLGGDEFALDDFGTGYSSLTCLKRLPESLLKIDQSFVRDMLDDPDDLAILEGVISLASAFRRQVIAEGVETVEHGKILLQLGCELAQGYGIARPIPASDLPSWVASRRPDANWSNLAPVDRDDYPLLFAATEHRAWIAAMGKHLKDARNEPPAMDFHRCRFGQWLDADGQSRYGSHPDFWRIEHLHRQVHDLAETLCEYRKSNSFEEVQGEIGELHALRDQLLARLQLLLHNSRR